MEQGFVRDKYRNLLIHRDRPADLLQALADTSAPGARSNFAAVRGMNLHI